VVGGEDEGGGYAYWARADYYGLLSRLLEGVDDIGADDNDE